MSKYSQNIFSGNFSQLEEDPKLVVKAQKGDKSALEMLIKIHQEWIYNITLRMIGNPTDAEDLTQEILVKVVTKLSTFENRSKFTTWLYRIAVNHTLNAKRTVWERYFNSLEKYGEVIDSLEKLNSFGYTDVEKKIFEEETRRGCMTGMLVCLERKQRIVLILGSIFNLDSKTGAEILEITPDNFRKILSRTRKQLANFMNEKCGLMNEKNSCRCQTKIKSAIEKRYVDPGCLRFNREYEKKINDLVTETEQKLKSNVEVRMQHLFRDEPMYKGPDFVKYLNKLLTKKEFNRFVNFN